MPPHLNDLKLAKALAAGEEKAFDLFYEAYFDKLYRFISSRLDSDAVQDVLQNTMINALKHIASYRGEASMFTWLCQISRSELSAHFKRIRRDQQRAVADGDDDTIRQILEAVEAPDNDRPDIQSERQEMIKLILLTLDYLPERYGDILEWKYVKGCSVNFIAEQLGQSPKAVQSLLQRARNAFRETFQNAADIVLEKAP